MHTFTCMYVCTYVYVKVRPYEWLAVSQQLRTSLSDIHVGQSRHIHTCKYAYTAYTNAHMQVRLHSVLTQLSAIKYFPSIACLSASSVLVFRANCSQRVPFTYTTLLMIDQPHLT
jgi:hypothetical protein